MSSARSGATGGFELRTEILGALPVVNHFLDRLGVGRLLERSRPP